MSQVLFTASGQRIALAKELGRGGEGSVFEVANGSQVAKLYHHRLDPLKQDKLRYMAGHADAQLLQYVAWPQETLHKSAGGEVVGFLMPRVQAKEPVHMVYSPAHRRQEHPEKAWDFLLYVARNIAASFETVHSHGHVIGDVNQSGVMVGRDSKVVLIDSDSFQVNAGGTLHLCRVGVPHFTPPELQQLKSFDGVVRTANHDNFGLALLIFHVLFGGRHPYSGVPLTAGAGDVLEDDIRRFRYAYGIDSQQRGLKPPPRSVPIDLMPSDVQSMFHAAFTERGVSGQRPNAALWVAALDRVRGHLQRCSVSPMHVYPSHLGGCPWCALEKSGVIYFIDLGVTVAPAGASGFNLTQTWALIQAIPAPQPLRIPVPRQLDVTAKPLPPGVTSAATTRAYQLACVCVAIVAFFVYPAALMGWAALAFIAWQAIGGRGRDSREAELNKRLAEQRAAEENFNDMVEQAKASSAAAQFERRRQDLAAAKSRYEALPAEEKRAIDELHHTARDRQLQKHLDKFFIDSASISGVGPARKATLRSFGIETAADVTVARIRGVRGFGEGLTRAMLSWRAQCEASFHFNTALGVTAADVHAVRVKFAAKRAALEHQLATAPAELNALRQKAQAEVTWLDERLQSTGRRLAQARADVAALR